MVVNLKVSRALLVLALLWQQDRVDVGDDTTGRDGDAAEQLVQLLVVAHSQLQVAWHDAVALVVARRIAGQLQDFGGQVLEHGSHVDWRAGTDTGGVATLTQVTVHTTNCEVRGEVSRRQRHWHRLPTTAAICVPGNCNPARDERLVEAPVAFFPFPARRESVSGRRCDKQKRVSEKSGG